MYQTLHVLLLQGPNTHERTFVLWWPFQLVEEFKVSPIWTVCQGMKSPVHFKNRRWTLWLSPLSLQTLDQIIAHMTKRLLHIMCGSVCFWNSKCWCSFCPVYACTKKNIGYFEICHLYEFELPGRCSAQCLSRLHQAKLEQPKDRAPWLVWSWLLESSPCIAGHLALLLVLHAYILKTQVIWFVWVCIIFGHCQRQQNNGWHIL